MVDIQPSNISVFQHINSVFSSNTYLLINAKEKWIWLIDCGDIINLLSMFIGFEIKGVFLTHTHYDHIYGLKELLNVYPDCKIYTSKFGKKCLASSKLNFSRYHGDSIELKSRNIIVLNEGDLIKLDLNSFVKVYYTPGHDISCLTYKLGDKLFTGDSFIPNRKLVTTFPNSNKDEALYSVHRILQFIKDCDLFPGHGTAFVNFLYKNNE